MFSYLVYLVQILCINLHKTDHTTLAVRNKYEKLEGKAEIIFNTPFVIQSQAERMTKIVGAVFLTFVRLCITNGVSKMPQLLPTKFSCLFLTACLDKGQLISEVNLMSKIFPKLQEFLPKNVKSGQIKQIKAHDYTNQQSTNWHQL